MKKTRKNISKKLLLIFGIAFLSIIALTTFSSAYQIVHYSTIDPSYYAGYGNYNSYNNYYGYPYSTRVRTIYVKPQQSVYSYNDPYYNFNRLDTRYSGYQRYTSIYQRQPNYYEIRYNSPSNYYTETYSLQQRRYDDFTPRYNSYSW